MTTIVKKKNYTLLAKNSDVYVKDRDGTRKTVMFGSKSGDSNSYYDVNKNRVFMFSGRATPSNMKNPKNWKMRRL